MFIQLGSRKQTKFLRKTVFYGWIKVSVLMWLEVGNSYTINSSYFQFTAEQRSLQLKSKWLMTNVTGAKTGTDVWKTITSASCLTWTAHPFHPFKTCKQACIHIQHYLRFIITGWSEWDEAQLYGRCVCVWI